MASERLPATSVVHSDSRGIEVNGRTAPAAILLAAVVLAATLLRVVFFSGYQGRDDLHYIAYAYMTAEEGRVPTEHRTQWTGRIGTWLPMAVSIRAFGFNDIGIYGYSAICSVAGIALAYGLGMLTYGRPAALLASLLLAFAPQDVLLGTMAYADLPCGFFMVLCYYFFLLGEHRVENGRSAWPAYLAAGLAAGWAFLTRETAVVLVVPIALLVLWKRRLRREYLLVVLGGVAVLAAECAFWQSAADDPLFRYEALFERLAERRGDNESVPVAGLNRAFGSIGPGDPRRPGGYLFEPIVMFLTDQEFGLIYYFAWPVAAFVLLRDRRAAPLALWLVAIAFVICYLPLRWDRVLNRNPRYFDCLLIPALVLLAGWLIRLPAKWRWRLTGLIAASSLVCIYVDSSRFAAESLHTMADIVEDRPQESFLVPPRERFGLFAATDVECSERVGSHLLVTATTADSLQNVRMVCPEAPVVSSVGSVRDAIVLLPAGTKFPVPASWRRLSEVRVGRDRLAMRLIAALDALGVPARYLRRLLPDKDKQWIAWWTDDPSPGAAEDSP